MLPSDTAYQAYQAARQVAEDLEYPTEQARDIGLRLMPEWWLLFVRKNEGYGRVDNHLGPKGVFPDVNRKIGKLERVIWDGQPLPEGSEPVREVIMDLIGHLFLMLHMVDAEAYPAPLDPADYLPGTGEDVALRPTIEEQMADEEVAAQGLYANAPDEDDRDEHAPIPAPDLNYLVHDQVAAAYRVGRAPYKNGSGPEERLAEIVERITGWVESHSNIGRADSFVPRLDPRRLEEMSGVQASQPWYDSFREYAPTPNNNPMGVEVPGPTEAEWKERLKQLPMIPTSLPEIQFTPSNPPSMHFHYYKESAPSDGWDDLPDGARAALRCLAKGERVSDWARREVSKLVERDE